MPQIPAVPCRRSHSVRWFFFVISSLAMVSAAYAAPRVCDPRTMGAKADGQTKDTTALQRAIDTCSAGGGIVRLTAGTWLSAPLDLKSHVTLELEKGAELLGSPEMKD